ncbi:MAG: rhodanese-like domain-containing protein [Deltaproteobacteria bacterium]|nr:rhodanese-like domain-containing protein [Deltaproteobacteria bacterium]
MEETLPALRKTCLEPDHFAPLFAQGDVTVVDVRSAEEYQRGHLPGAVHIPLDQLPARSAELPAGRRIITVCGKGGGRSDQAAQILRQKGWLASSLCGGTLGWLARGQA